MQQDEVPRTPNHQRQTRPQSASWEDVMDRNLNDHDLMTLALGRQLPPRPMEFATGKWLPDLVDIADFHRFNSNDEALDAIQNGDVIAFPVAGRWISNTAWGEAEMILNVAGLSLYDGVPGSGEVQQ